jgi:hypothetical protein
MRNPADYDGKIISVLGETAVLSDKRLFCTGPYINVKNGKRLRVKDNAIYEMKDYKNSRIRQTKPLWLLVIGLLTAAYSTFTAVSAFNAWVRFDSEVSQWLTFFFTGVAATVILLVYTHLRRSWLEVHFSDATLIYNVTAVNSLDVQEFQRNLRLVNKGRFV